MGPFLAGCLILLLWVAVQCSAFVRDETEYNIKGTSDEPIGKKKYVVYMGATGDAEAEALILSQQNVLANAVGSEEEALDSMVHSYKHAFNGFSAWLTEAQAESITKLPEVMKIFPSRILQLQTTRSWEFLGSSSPSFSKSSTSQAPNDIIVGVLDTGVWPESESFSDDGMDPVPARWKGTCDNGGVTNASEIIHCNKKLIGVRSYFSSGMFQNARDEVGHGTHTTSTIAGRVVKGANAFGLGTGNARGGLPTARVAMYKVCGEGCSEDAILAGFDDAIHDGVDILSLSLGGPPFSYDVDPIAIASFHATQRGILVSCAGGNAGPGNSSVSNAAPWILTVGASTIDRSFAATINLGNGKTLLGTALNFYQMQKPSKILSGADAASSSANAAKASFCAAGSLDAHKVKGNIIACTYDPFASARASINTELRNMGAAGLILGNDVYADLMPYFVLPGAMVKLPVLQAILAYTKTSNPTASILPTQTVLGTSAPAVAGFSSRGPNIVSEDILKPDVIAPGVNILASWSPVSPVYYREYNISLPVYSNFSIISGTSMACPHVSGAAAFVKSVHPDWSPAAIKSALITTAKYLDNRNSSIKDYDGTEATPFATGAGEISPEDAINPGLVYDIVMEDYVTYLCASGYSSAELKVITGDKNVSCPATPGAPYLNYPSITIPNLGNTSSVARTVTNVGPANSVYKVTGEPPVGVELVVSPAELNFTSAGQKLGFNVEFKAIGEPLTKWVFGSITWTSGSVSVRSPLAITG